MSRREVLTRLRAPFDEAPLPANEVQYLMQWFVESGMVLQGGMGPAPLTWGEVEAFSEGTRSRLSAWERQQIISMSRAYAAGLSAYKDQQAEAPYQSDETAAEYAKRAEDSRRRKQAAEQSREQRKTRRKVSGA